MKKIPPAGPAPVPVAESLPAEVADPSRQRLLHLVAEHAASAPPTVGDLAASVGGHPNTTRHHLRVLVEAGLVAEERRVPAGGRGRPAAGYVLTEAGRRVVSATPRGGAAEEYVALAAAFADRLAERGGDPGEDARAIGKAWGAGLATRHSDAGSSGRPGGEQVVGLLDRLGFSPLAEPAELPERGTTVLLRTCPLLDAARRHPEVVCQVHLGLVAGALEAHHEPSDGVRLVPFARPGACELGLPPHTGAMSSDHPGPPAGGDGRGAAPGRRMPSEAPSGDVTVVVLAGGTSRRFGADKLGARLHGSTVLETAVRSLPASWPVVVVGPERDCGRRVAWTREDPPGGGPLAGVAAGMQLVRTPLVAVVAGDMPFAGPALERLVHVLRTAPPEVGAAVAGDDGGWVNPLLAAYRAASVLAVLPVPAANRAAKLLLAVPHVEVAVTGPAGRDVDTPADLEALTDPT